MTAYSDAIEQLREAFPLLVWVKAGNYCIGSNSEDPLAGAGSPWRIAVSDDLKFTSLDGFIARASAFSLKPDPIADLRAIIEAEGIRLARESDELADAARLLGGQPQSDWRAAMAEDSSSYMARELADARARIAELERQRDEHYRDNEEICEQDPREGCACAGCHTRRERYSARMVSETATVRQLLADATTELSRASLSGRLRRLEEELTEATPQT